MLKYSYNMWDLETEFNDLDAKKDWAAFYQIIRNECGEFTFTTKEAKKVENKNLNRYRDVSPYDHSRVKLQYGENDYINASLLKVADAHRAYILTQGPLPHTTSHFWQMVWEQNSKAVLMLNKVIEKNAVKCHQYWPLGSKNNGEDEMNLEQVGLCVHYVSETETSHYIIRHLRLVHLKSGESRIVLHFHYTTWPDFSVPQSPSAFLNFLFAVRESGALDEDVGPPVVHCSAGIGRSGTFCLVDSCLVLIEKYQDLNAINIKKILLEMRKYRMGLIQTPDQLRFSYLAVLEGSKRVLGDENSSKVNVFMARKANVFNGERSVENDDGGDSVSTDVSQSSDDSADSKTCEDIVPQLPPKRPRKDYTDTISSHDCSSLNKEEHANDENSNNSPQDDNVLKNDVGHSFKAASDGKEKPEKQQQQQQQQEQCSMTMKDGAVVTNFSEKLKEAELRKRQRKEQNEKMREKVRAIQLKQRESEEWQRRRSFLKPISFSLLLLLGGGYLVYRYFWKD